MLAAATIAIASSVTACDQGHQDVEPLVGSAYVHLVASNVAPERPLPADGTIQLAFDRLLLPTTVTRQSFAIIDAFGNLAATPIIAYDPVARVVSIANPNVTAGAWLEPMQPYTLLMGIPTGEEDTGGVRAIDRATLDPSQPLELGFMTTAVANAVNPDPTVAFCSDVLPLFQRSCNGGACHGAPTVGADALRFPNGEVSAPAEGLLLATAPGVAATAIHRVANESNTGPIAGAGEPPNHLFGTDMPIVDPQDPANSWLLYKMLLAPIPDTPTAAPSPYIDCTGAAIPPFAPYAYASVETTPLSDAERDVLSDYVLGEPMPYPYFTPDGGIDQASTGALSFDELERVRLWIAQGADVPDCSMCL